VHWFALPASVHGISGIAFAALHGNAYLDNAGIVMPIGRLACIQPVFERQSYRPSSILENNS
jgi:hypothetical protein